MKSWYHLRMKDFHFWMAFTVDKWFKLHCRAYDHHRDKWRKLNDPVGIGIKIERSE